MVLLTLDTDRVKSYVFATSKLREIRGASALLDDINERRIAEMIGRRRVVYAGGGTVLAEVKDFNEADKLIEQAEQLYRRKMISAEVTGAWVEVPDPSPSFGQSVIELNYKLRARKEAKRPRRSLVTSPVLKVCESCGLYPAAKQLKVEEENSLICDPCALKWEASWKVRKGEATQQVREGTLISRLAELLEYASSQWPNLNIEENAPEDFNEIGATATPAGYIGFIYCDGNRMGDLVSKLETRESFKAFSDGLREILQKITFDALLKYFPEQRRLADPDRKPILPFEIIFIGGDDLMLVVAADKAIELATDLCQKFERQTRELMNRLGKPDQREHLSLSAAVVFAHAALPIYQLQSIADDLLKSAKRESQKRIDASKREGQKRIDADKGDVGYIDFHVVTASAAESPLLTRKTEWVREDVRLTERPYTAEELRRLLDRIRALKKTGFPSSKLQMLYEAILGRSKVQAMFTWAFVAGRAKRNKDADKDQLSRLFDFFLQGSGPLLWPWREREPGKLSTPMLDVAELYDFTK